MKKKYINAVLIILLAATLAFIWGNSALSRDTSGSMSSDVTEVLKPVLEPILKPITDKNNQIFGLNLEGFIRKIAHFSEFAFLGALLYALRAVNGRPAPFTLLFFALACGVTDETIQVFTGRGSSVTDVIIDFCGCVSGMLLFMLLNRLRKYLKQKYGKKAKRQAG